MKAFLDTHVAVLLYSGRVGDLGVRSRDLLDRSALFVSPFVRLELRVLTEIGRLKQDADSVLGALGAEVGLAVSHESVADVVAKSLELSWTRDTIDRLLVATAMLHGAPLVTRDRRIRENFAEAVW